MRVACKIILNIIIIYYNILSLRCGYSSIVSNTNGVLPVVICILSYIHSSFISSSYSFESESDAYPCVIGSFLYPFLF